jgi:fructosamine-3-kinase
MARALGSAVAACQRQAGGDINDAYSVALSDGRRVFAKTNARAAPDFFASEARGLAWLAETGALRVPVVLGVGSGGDGTAPFLLLEWIEPATRARNFDERLGVGLAAVHRAGAGGFGFERDNFIALLPQDNRPAPSWAPARAPRSARGPRGAAGAPAR